MAIGGGEPVGGWSGVLDEAGFAYQMTSADEVTLARASCGIGKAVIAPF